MEVACHSKRLLSINQNTRRYSPEDAFRIFTKSKGKVHPRTGTEALYMPYGP